MSLWRRAARHERWLFGVLALGVALLLTRGVVGRPSYTDAFYYHNAAVRLVQGQGLTDAYLWTFINAPDALPAPSHLYWMPLTSLLAAGGMALFGVSYGAAQAPFTLLLAALALIGYGLGRVLVPARYGGWAAGGLVLASGFYARYWGQTSTFAPFGVFGALALLCAGVGARRAGALWLFALCGLFSALGHLTRADGLLLLLAGGVAALWPRASTRWPGRVSAACVLVVAYTLVMTQYALRMITLTGAPLPTGGLQAAWLTEYNDMFRWPPDASPSRLLAAGPAVLLRTRWDALVNNMGTFVAVQGWVVLAPFMVLGAWARRHDPLLRAFLPYVLALHAAMTLVFALPGYRGGLFHSAAALVPWWAALGLAGLHDAVGWAARRRRHWHARRAAGVFTVGVLMWAAWLTFQGASQGRVMPGTPPLYAQLDRVLPPDARVMSNDPALLYHFTGRGGVVLPNNPPDVMRALAAHYEVSYVLLEGVTPDGVALFAPAPLADLPGAPPPYLRRVPLDDAEEVRLYALVDDDNASP